MIYNDIPIAQFDKEKEYLVNSIFKLLPLKQEEYEYLDNYFESVLQRIVGFNKVSGFQSEILTVISLLEYARNENDYRKYRKAILDSCGLMKSIEMRCLHE